MTDALIDMEAAVLFAQDYSPPDFAELLHRINAELSDLGIVLTSTPLSSDTFAMLSCDELHVLISLNDKPLAPPGFARTLRSPYTQMNRAGFADRVAAHRSNIFVTVGDGPVAMTPEMLNFRQKLGMTDNRQAAALELKISILHRAVIQILDMVRPPPSAIHWCQSDTLHTPERILTTRKMAFPVPLVTHPGLYSSGKVVDGRRLVGIVSNHSHWFCGKTIVVPEVADTGRMLRAIDYVIEGFISGTVALGQGETVDVPRIGRVKISHLPPAEGFPDGKIEVSPAQSGENASGEPQAPTALRISVGANSDGAPARQHGAPESNTQAKPDVDVDTIAPRIAQDLLQEAPKRSRGGSVPLLSKPRANALQDAPASSALERFIAVDNSESWPRYLLISAAMFLVAPLLGLAMAGLTLVRGPMPRVMLLFSLVSFIILALKISPL